MGCQCQHHISPEEEILSRQKNLQGNEEAIEEPQNENGDKPIKSKGGYYRIQYGGSGGGFGNFEGFSGFSGFDNAFNDFGNDFSTGRVVRREVISKNDYDNSNKNANTKDLTNEVLQLINEKRKLHGVQPLTLNQTINKLAIESASSNAQKDDLDYANQEYKKEPLGECLFACSGNPSASKIVNEWYNESKNYDYNTGNNGGNFTQLVWKGSKEFGFGMKKSRSGMNYIIGLFYPAGNYCGEHRENVFPVGTPLQVDKETTNKKPNRQTDYYKINNDDYEEDDFDKQKKKIMDQFENFAKDYGGNSGNTQYVYYDSRDNKKNNNRKQQVIYEEEQPEYDNATGSTGDFAQDALQAHNKYRTKHHAPPLKLNSELNRIAQQYANYLAQSDSFQHSNNEYKGESLGENLYMCYGQKITGKAMTDAWYDEIKQYNFNSSTFTSGTGHFTQVVWKDSKEVGFAYAQSRSGNYYGVANYYPAGNFMGEFRQNVLPA